MVLRFQKNQSLNHSMRNQELAKIFNDMARFLEMEGVAFKPYAYQRAAISLETLSEDVGEIYRRGGKKALMEISGVGEGIAKAIEELSLIHI